MNCTELRILAKGLNFQFNLLDTRIEELKIQPQTNTILTEINALEMEKSGIEKELTAVLQDLKKCK